MMCYRVRCLKSFWEHKGLTYSSCRIKAARHGHATLCQSATIVKRNNCHLQPLVFMLVNVLIYKLSIPFICNTLGMCLLTLDVPKYNYRTTLLILLAALEHGK